MNKNVQESTTIEKLQNPSMIPEKILRDTKYFSAFNLNLSEKSNYYNKNFATLNDEECFVFGLKTIRNIILKQNSPKNDSSSMYEIFNRLNSGSVKLKPQEIRKCMYHSKFYDMLYNLNLNNNWRYLLSSPIPDIYMKDVEILLRSFAMLLSYKEYSPSMTSFLNDFSDKAKNFKEEEIDFLKVLFIEFINYICSLNNKDIFCTEKNKFNISFFESIFTVLCEKAYEQRDITKIHKACVKKIDNLKNNKDFKNASTESTASKQHVAERIKLAKENLL
ncbi:hypothetical protein [Candidatus Ruminimicrobium bovinum]|uniref:hypothetical protein n=1 Tax=Candidatus Ruminimicrobium bovinum TaxID=3242779 RepID=UPI0039B82EC8